MRHCIVLLAIACAVVLRVAYLGDGEVSNDEAFSWRITRYSCPEMIDRTAADVHPPLYYLLLKGWSLVFGSSMVALRGLSALLGTAGVICTYYLGQECRMLGRSPPERTSTSAAWMNGALFALSLAAVHLSQVSAARTARMYSLGTLLAALTGVLLLRTLRASGPRVLWWSAYGLAATAFCYTHYYAVFTLFAQMLFVVLYHGGRGSHDVAGGGARIRNIGGAVLAAALAVLLYRPWMKVLAGQYAEVQTDFWIPEVSTQRTYDALVVWVTGVDAPQSIVWTLIAVGMTLLAMPGALRTGHQGFFLLLQTGIPWALAIFISAGSRSVFSAKYLVFAHVSLILLWGASWTTLRTAGRWLVVIVVGGALSLGLYVKFLGSCGNIPAIAKAVELLRAHYHGEAIIVPLPRDVNRLRYYAVQEGLSRLDVRCTVSPLRPGHIPHLASLQAKEITWGRQIPRDLNGQRFWIARENLYDRPDTGMSTSRRVSWTFTGAGGKQYTLVLCEQ